jgi:hypothetical protein
MVRMSELEESFLKEGLEHMRNTYYMSERTLKESEHWTTSQWLDHRRCSLCCKFLYHLYPDAICPTCSINERIRKGELTNDWTGFNFVPDISRIIIQMIHREQLEHEIIKWRSAHYHKPSVTEFFVHLKSTTFYLCGFCNLNLQSDLSTLILTVKRNTDREKHFLKVVDDVSGELGTLKAVRSGEVFGFALLGQKITIFSTILFYYNIQKKIHSSQVTLLTIQLDLFCLNPICSALKKAN